MTATLFVGIGEREHWGKGLGTEATRLICEYGFFFRSLHSIKVEVNGYNRRAIRVYERLGFKLVGRLRDVIVMNGNRYDQVIMDSAAPRAHIGARGALPKFSLMTVLMWVSSPLSVRPRGSGDPDLARLDEFGSWVPAFAETNGDRRAEPFYRVCARAAFSSAR